MARRRVGRLDGPALERWSGLAGETDVRVGGAGLRVSTEGAARRHGAEDGSRAGHRRGREGDGAAAGLTHRTGAARLAPVRVEPVEIEPAGLTPAAAAHAL